MRYIECPNLFNANRLADFRKTLFLGGGISNCGDWQQDMVKLLETTDLILLNPRRRNFDMANEAMTVEQIVWEHAHLQLAHARLFWFPPETLCPITLFELGKFCSHTNPVFVGCHPEYKRKIDLQVQMHLVGQEVVYDLYTLAEKVKGWFQHREAPSLDSGNRLPHHPKELGCGG